MPNFKKDKDVNEFSMENPLQPAKNMAYWKAKNKTTSPFPVKLSEIGLRGGVNRMWAGDDARDKARGDTIMKLYGNMGGGK